MEKKSANNFNQKDLFKRPLLFGGIASIVTIFLSLSIEVLHLFIPNFQIILVFALLVCGFFNSYAFFVVGKRYKNSLLKITAVLLFILLVLVSVFILLGPVIFKTNLQQLDQIALRYNQTISNLALNQTFAESIQDIENPLLTEITPIVAPFIATLLFLYLAYAITSILFGISLIKISKEVPYAKFAGILIVIVPILLFFFFGVFVIIAAWILQIMILFDQAKKFKEFNEKN